MKSVPDATIRSGFAVGGKYCPSSARSRRNLVMLEGIIE